MARLDLANLSEEELKQASKSLVELFSVNHEMAHYTKTRAHGAPEVRPDSYRTVGIVGGGTAGFLTALALRKKLPHLAVTLIESSQIPIIGVGEASTPNLLQFLHGSIGLDVVELYQKVRPTWKQGIKFEWGEPGTYHFQAPFDWGTNSVGLLGSLKYDGNINAQTILSLMMERDVSPVLRLGEGRYASFLGHAPHAYHLDNETFVRYLHEVTIRAGVTYLDRKITAAVTTADGQEIDHLVTAEGEKLRYDLFIDCTGFRSLLLEGKLGSPFISFASSLFTDRALTFNVPHGGHLKPYTTAKSMHSGWCWIIPTEKADHCGYVHCSAFCNPDEAEREARAAFPQMSKPHNVVHFRSGRHGEMWKGNVIAIGNAYGFVEPLESTGILMIHETVEALTKVFPESKADRSVKDLLNRWVGSRWDALRWFLSVHYKFNRRFSTPFWTEVRDRTDISGAQSLLDAFRELAPLFFRDPASHNVLKTWVTNSLFGLQAYDCILLGQKEPARLFEVTEPEAKWRERKSLALALCDMALPEADALRVVHQHPELLVQAMSEPGGWLERQSQL